MQPRRKFEPCEALESIENVGPRLAQLVEGLINDLSGTWIRAKM